MDANKIVSLVKLNSVIVILSIILFSPGFLGLKMNSSDSFEGLLAIILMVIGGIVFVLGNYNILIDEKDEITVEEMETLDDYIYALRENSSKKIFTKDINALFDQIDRLVRKIEKIDSILLQKFDCKEISYSKFRYTIDEITKLFFINLKSVINKMNIFDEQEYIRVTKEVRSGRFRSNVIEQKIMIQQEYIGFVKKSIEDNEQILLKLDRILLELSSFNSLDKGELESMLAMKEIDELIKKIQLYK